MKMIAETEYMLSTRIGPMWTASLTARPSEYSKVGIKGSPMGRSSLSASDALRDLAERIEMESGIKVQLAVNETLSDK